MTLQQVREIQSKLDKLFNIRDKLDKQIQKLHNEQMKEINRPHPNVIRNKKRRYQTSSEHQYSGENK